MTEKFGKVDFEIALTALLATVVTTYPSPDLEGYALFKLSAIGLLVLTLIRRAVLMSEGDTKQATLAASSHGLLALTSLCLLYIAYLLTSLISRYSIFSVQTILETALIVFPLMLLVLHYFVVGNIFNLAGETFADFAEENENLYTREKVRRTLKRFEQFTSNSYHERVEDSSVNLEELSENEKQRLRLHYALEKLGWILAGVFYCLAPISWTIILNLNIFVAAWTFLGVLSTHALAKFWYSSYGLMPLDYGSGLLEGIFQVSVYSAFVWMFMK